MFTLPHFRRLLRERLRRSVVYSDDVCCWPECDFSISLGKITLPEAFAFSHRKSLRTTAGDGPYWPVAEEALSVPLRAGQDSRDALGSPVQVRCAPGSGSSLSSNDA